MINKDSIDNQSLQAQMQEITPINSVKTDNAKTTAASPNVALRHYPLVLSKSHPTLHERHTL